MEKTILKICMQKGFLLDKEMLALLSSLDEESAKQLIEGLSNLKIQERVITKALFSRNIENINKILVGGVGKTVIEQFFINLGYCRTEIKESAPVSKEKEYGKVKLITSPIVVAKKVSVSDFVKYYRARYEQMKSILQERELENLSSLRKIGNKRESYTVIASVFSKKLTKNKNLLLEVEDPTGKCVVLVNQNKEELFKKAKDLLLDDIVAFSVVGDSSMLFANDIIYPEAVISEKKKLDVEEWVAFTSDMHIGSKMFLEKNLLKFISWLNCEEGDEKQKEIARKIKYLFLVGDNIDGVGRYPTQEAFLTMKDSKVQYKRLAEILGSIRKDIKIIMCPGQHDSVWVGEPQPVIGEEWAPDLHKLENLTLVPNPSLVEIDGNFRVLMYHGASMNTFIEEIEDLRLTNAHDHPTRVAKEILKRRHLAPVHGSVDYVPNETEDPLVIKYIPDIFATGDQHKADIGVYNNILLIASSCWQSITPFEEKVGNHPDPCKVPLLNLKTREIKILDFSDNETESKFANVSGEKVGVQQVQQQNITVSASAEVKK